MTSTSHLFALIICIAVSGLSHAQKAEMPSPAAFSVGEEWEWRQVDNRTKLEEARVSRTVVSVDGSLQFSNGTASSPISSVFVNGTAMESPKPWRVWPLEVGKKWVFNADWVRADGVRGSTKQDAHVVAYEEITVPAGKFMAFKIEYRGWWTLKAGGNGMQNDTYWFAPNAKADVKHFRDDRYNLYTRELVTYKRGAP